MKVFVVEDSVLMRDRLAAMLAEQLPGVEIVGQADSPALAIESIRSLRPDVVILDLRLPNGSGLDVLRAIKEEGLGPGVIVLTNYPYRQYREKCAAAGADFFLDKSNEFDRVPSACVELAEGRTN